MSEINESLERLIHRCLDHDLSETEQLELDRELIRNPAARRLFEDYQTIDRLATTAIRHVVGDVSADVDVLDGRAARPKRRLAHPHVWWVVPGAIAAALLAMIVPYPGPSFRESMPINPAVSFAPAPVRSPWGEGAMNVSHRDRAVPRYQTDRGTDVIGVIGDDGNLYWIEVERTRTIKLPPRDRSLDSM
jgi:hypothetical protein